MTTKSTSYLIFVTAIGFAAMILASFPGNADNKEGKLWNLQKLEEVAEAGDIEAQLRLIDFYRMNINSRDHYGKKLEYWRQKTETSKETDQYKAAVSKLGKERAEKHKLEREKQEAARARLQAMKEKYEKLGPDTKRNETQIWHDALNAVFNLEEAYSWKNVYQWRYRLTVNIETPEGIKSGMALHELYFPPADENTYVSSNMGIARGEAIYIDLGERGSVYAILPDPANARNRFKGNIRTVFPTVPAVYDTNELHAVLQHYDELKDVKDALPPYLYPIFVRFRDESNPQTIELIYRRKRGSVRDMQQVEVDRFEEVFGEGVKIKNITLEMTDDPLEWKLQNQLSWLESMEEKEVTNLLRKASTPFYVLNGIGYSNFRQAQQDPWEKIKAEKGAKQQVKDRLSKYQPYDSYDDVPGVLRKHMFHLMTFDRYVETITKAGHANTDQELDLAIRAFVTHDLNKDGIISYNESRERSKYLSSTRPK